MCTRKISTKIQKCAENVPSNVSLIHLFSFHKTNFDIIVDCCRSRWPHWLTRTDFRWHNTRAFYTTYSSNCELIAFLKRLSWSETYIFMM